ncbi:MAG: radical SAM protein [Candidatus Omnitrophota bacterium]
MKIAFINISLRPDSKRRQLPVGLAYVMTAAGKAGFGFDLIDMDINNLGMQDLERIASGGKYDVYAMGCIVTGFRLVRQISEVIKKNSPAAVIIAGNSVATSIPELLLEHTKVDIAVIGEADITIVELLKALDSKKPMSGVKGIAFKENGRVVCTQKQPIIPDLDTVGFPDWDIFELDKYEKYASINVNNFSGDEILSYPLNFARGCPFSCTFCYHVFKGEKYRRYSEDACIEEMKRLHSKYSCDFISFWDELTFPSLKSVEDMVRKIKKLDFKITWQATVRGDLFKTKDLDLVKAMKESGCDNVGFSLENADPDILKAINKKISVSNVIEQAKVLWQGGVVPITSVIFGYPQETPASIRRTVEVCEECRMYPSSGFLLPLPGTQVYEWAKANGHITNDVEYLERIGDRQDFHINLTGMPDDEFVSLVENELRALSVRLGLKLDSVFKTVTYQKPKDSLTK